MLRASFVFVCRTVSFRGSPVPRVYPQLEAPLRHAEALSHSLGERYSSQDARSVIANTFNILSQKLNTEDLGPVYETVQQLGAREGKMAWRTTITVNWPKPFSCESVGQNKRVAEELAAQKALTMLQHLKVITESGKLNTGVLNPPKENHYSSQSHQAGRIFSDKEIATKDELLEIEQLFPTPRNALSIFYARVQSHMKNPGLKVDPTFTRVKSSTRKSACKASYTIQWPTTKTFSSVADSRKEAARWASLSVLHWLRYEGYLNDKGNPIMHSQDQLEEWKSSRRMPSAITVDNETVRELEQLCQDFNAQVKPLLDEDRKTCHIQHSLPMPEGEDALEEMQEASQSTFDDGGRSQEEDEGYSVDPLTGWRRRPLSPYEVERRNDQLLSNYERRLRNSVGNQAPLPIKDKRQNILDLIDNNRVVVLSGDTGCGKSTQMPQFLLDHFAQQRRGSECNIIVTQPRRLAALALAQTVAKDRGETVGQSIGYQVRLNSAMPKERGGCVLFCSTGILLRRLQACPDLDGISHLIIDEVHERDVLTDFLLVIVKDLLKRNDSIKVVLMSASLNAGLLSNYFSRAPLYHVSGRTFPVKQHFLNDVLQLVGQRNQKDLQTTSTRPMVNLDLVLKLIRHIDANKPSQGAILCFLPGWQDIKSLHSRLKELYPNESTHWILPVHSRLSQREQERIFDRPPLGIRKIVLATNIAETSLTINDVVYVIDPGVHKEMRFNPNRGTAVMDNQWVSKANVQQRMGRAGRVQPGESYHLFPVEKFESMEQFPQAEILRIPLEKVIMDIKAYNEDLKAKDFFCRALEPPSLKATQDAIAVLEMIGALDENERLTFLGRRIASFSTDPRLAKVMVFSALFGCIDPVLDIVAGLSSSREAWDIGGFEKKEIRDAKRTFHRDSDHLALANLVKQFRNIPGGRDDVDEFCQGTGTNPKALHFLKGVRNLLVDHLYESKLLNDKESASNPDLSCNKYSNNDELVKTILLMGIGDRLLRVRRGRLVKGTLKSDEFIFVNQKQEGVVLLGDTVNASQDPSSDFLFYFNGVYLTERKTFAVRDSSQISSVGAAIAAGSALKSRWVGDQVVLSVDDQHQFQFSCDPRVAALLRSLRSNLDDTCDYLLRTIGLRQVDDLTMLAIDHHRRFVALLARMLKESSS